MKSRSPFKAKIDIFQGSTSTYRHPSTVIQPIVGAQVGAQIAKTASEVTVKAIEAKSEKPKKQFDFKVGPKPEALTVPDFEYNFRTSGGKETREVKANRTFLKDLSEKDRVAAEQWIEKNPKKHKELLAKKKASNVNQFRTYSLDDEGNKTNFSDWRNSPNTMKGSPAKQIDPYAAINPEAVPGSQAQNVLGAQPIVGADMNQARNVDMQAMIDPYKSPGATFKPGEKINAENIYGQAGQRQALMNLGSPTHAHTPDHDKKSDSLAISKLEKKAKFPSKFKTFKEAVQARDSAHSMYKRLSKAGLNDLSTRASELENLIGQETDQGPEDFKRLKQQ
jgi:hypothetical protein